MPSFSSQSSVRVTSQDYVLHLKITHNLVHGSPSDTVHSFKGRLPKELDVLWLSDISIPFSGSFDGHQIPPHDIARSGFVRHLQAQLKANADQLGLNNVSHLFVDDIDGLPKLTITPSRPLPNASRPHANLVSLHLAYIWRTVAWRSDITDSSHLVEEINPFSSALFLPAETLLNRAIKQFLIYHLVSRYPLIFGPWCKRLDLEMHYFPSIGCSIMEIMTRSENHMFLSKCKRLLKIARRQHKFVLQTAAAALSSCTNDAAPETSEEEMDKLVKMPVLTDEQVLCQSLEQLFRSGVPRRRFKPATGVAPHLAPAQDDDSLLQCMPDVGIDDEDLWMELPDIVAPPFADCTQTSSEDMDVFAEEDWPESGAWRLHEADVDLDERGFDDRSDESLISGPISLASITTRSAQAGPVTLYHHQGVGHGELDSAASGLRYKVSLEGARNSAVFASPTRSPSCEPHDHYYSGKFEQVMGYMETYRVDSEGFECLDSLSDLDEVAGSNSILFELDDVPDGTDVGVLDEPLV